MGRPYKMALSFHPFISKTYVMPNQANRSNGSNNASKGQPKHDQSRSSEEKPNPERSDIKHNSNEGEKGDTSRTSNQGRKTASGGSADD